MNVNFDELNSTTHEAFYDSIYDLIHKGHPVLALMEKKKRVLGGGSAIAVSVEYDDLQTFDYGKGTNFGAVDKEIFSTALFPIRGAGSTVLLDNFTLAMNSGAVAFHDIMEEKMKSLGKSLRKKIATDLFGSNIAPNAKGLMGLDAAIADDDTAGVYGGISANTYSYWRSVVESNGGEANPLAESLLQKVYMKTTEGGTDKDGLIIATSYEVYNIIRAYLLKKHNVIQPNKLLANLGFDSLTFNGVPIVATPELEGKHDIYFINTDYFQLNTLKKNDFRLRGWEKDQQSDQIVNAMLVQGNFVTLKRGALGKITNIDINEAMID